MQIFFALPDFKQKWNSRLTSVIFRFNQATVFVWLFLFKQHFTRQRFQLFFLFPDFISLNRDRKYQILNRQSYHTMLNNLLKYMQKQATFLFFFFLYLTSKTLFQQNALDWIQFTCKPAVPFKITLITHKHRHFINTICKYCTLMLNWHMKQCQIPKHAVQIKF